MGDIEVKQPPGDKEGQDAGAFDAASLEQTLPSSDNAPANDTSESQRESVGAHVLDALSDPERDAFTAFLVTSPETQSEVRELAAVVAVLPRLLTLDSVVLGGDGDAGAKVPAPSTALRDRIMAAALVELSERPAPAIAPAAVSDAATGETQDIEGGLSDPFPIEPLATAETPPLADAGLGSPGQVNPPMPSGLSPRPQGRIRAGTPIVTELGAPTPIRSLARLPRPWLAAAAMTLVSVGAIVWALALLGQSHDREREIRAQAAEIAQIRRDANATAYTLSATTDAPNTANGTFFFSSHQPQAVLLVQGLKPPAQGRVYQLWYLNGATAPAPGGTFTVDQNGNGFVVMVPSPGSFSGVALTQEPVGGSKNPTLPIIMQGAAATNAG